MTWMEAVNGASLMLLIAMATIVIAVGGLFVVRADKYIAFLNKLLGPMLASLLLSCILFFYAYMKLP